MTTKQARKPKLLTAKKIAVRELRKMVEDEKVDPQIRIRAAEVLLNAPVDSQEDES